MVKNTITYTGIIAWSELAYSEDFISRSNKLFKVAGTASTCRHQRAYTRLEQPGPGYLVFPLFFLESAKLPYKFPHTLLACGIKSYFHRDAQVYYQFISIERSVESLLATRDEASVQVEIFTLFFKTVPPVSFAFQLQ